MLRLWLWLLLLLPPFRVGALLISPPTRSTTAVSRGRHGPFSDRTRPLTITPRYADSRSNDMMDTTSTNKTAGFLETIMSTSNRQAVEDFLKSPTTELGLAFIVFASCVLFSLSTLDGTSGGQKGGIDLGVPVLSAIDTIEQAIGLVFLAEYCARWYYTGFSPSYLFTPYMLIDGAVVLPTILRLLNAPMIYGGVSFEFLRLLRVLRLQRFFSNPKSFQRTFGKFWAGAGNIKVWQLEVVNIVGEIITLLFIASGLVYQAEKAVNPQFSDFFAALYFGLTTLTTVGFGDIAPITPAGRAVVCLSIVFGVTIFPIQLSALANSLIRDTNLVEGTKSSTTPTTTTTTTTPTVPTTPSPSTTTSAPTSSTEIHIGGLETALETAMESKSFAAVAAEEGVDLATARRLVRAVLKVAPNSIETTNSKEVDSQLQD